MNRQRNKNASGSTQTRRGSTLIIVLALLSLLAFTGMMFYTFSAQERAAAEYFSEAAKAEQRVTEDPFPWAMEQLLIGANDAQKSSIVWGPRDATDRRTSRHSLVHLMLGSDTTLHSGEGIGWVYNGVGVPVLDVNHNGTFDAGVDVVPATPLQNPLEFVDSLALWGSQFGRDAVEQQVYGNRQLGGAGSTFPEPDVDYTYPDINNIFLGHRGWAIRDNGATPNQYERIPVYIPSFMRPALLKSGPNNGPSGNTVLTDSNWYDDAAAHGGFLFRTMRPHAQHIVGYDAAGNAVRRYLDATNPADNSAILNLPGASGPFPLRRNEGVNGANFGNLGLWTGDAPDDFVLDSDNDGDGVKEGIWMDFAYPVQETADGRLYGTLFSFTIYDLDSLIDLNIHGNLSGLARNGSIPNEATTSMTVSSLSQSNQGLGPNEVNPIWALRPSTLTTNPGPFSSWYGSGPGSALAQANMEFLWLLTGRMDGTDLFEGRWGDAPALWNLGQTLPGSGLVARLPRPGAARYTRPSDQPSLPSWYLFNAPGGLAGVDDNQNVLEGVAHPRTGVIRGFVHPMDFGGAGTSTVPGNPFVPSMLPNPTGTPEQWPGYINYPLVGENMNAILNDSPYLRGPDNDITTQADNLVQTSDRFLNVLLEDPLEVIVDLEAAQRTADQIFSPADLIPAHLTKTDIVAAQSDISTRLQDLAVEAFAADSDIAERFTTLTNSLRAIPLTRTPGRPWEANFPPTFGAIAPFTGADTFRPQVRRLLSGRDQTGNTRELAQRLPLSLNHIIDFDRPAPPVGSPEYSNYIRTAELRFRALTEHPDVSAANEPTIPSALPLPAFPPQTPDAQEFWARRDRQQMARDIYVLLYTVGGAQVNTATARDYTASNAHPARQLYTDEQLRQMAQFAVNVVDAMDTDNVITKFEYDKDLSDGWNLDDDPYTNSDDLAGILLPTDPDYAAVTRHGMYPDDSTARGVVYGVEAQQLAFSEVLAVRSAKLADDHEATSFDDTNGDPTNSLPTLQNDFLFVELQNMLPMPLDLGQPAVTGETVDKTIWRLVRRERDNADSPIQPPAEGLPTPPTHFVAFSSHIANRIDGGGRFSISATTATGAQVGSSDLFVDLGAPNAAGPPGYTGSFDGIYELIAPNAANGTLPTVSTNLPDPAFDPRCDLDLIAHAGQNRFYESAPEALLENVSALADYIGHHIDGPLGATAPDGNPLLIEGDFDPVTVPPGTLAGPKGFDLVLERRANPNMPSLSVLDNPWVEVDRIRVLLSDLNIQDMDTAAEVRGDVTTDRVRNIVSIERSEPLQDFRNPSVFNPATFRSNTLKGDATLPPDDSLGVNSGTPATGMAVWQPHFDRDFASPGELLHVPVFGPALLTQHLSRGRLAPLQQLGSVVPVPPFTDASISNASLAASLILWPDLDDDPTTPSVFDNRWYRLLGFLEVPSRVNRMLTNYASLRRIPGKVNLNGIRHTEVYAGLIDEPGLADVPLAGGTFAPFMQSFLPEGPSRIGVAPPYADFTIASTDIKDRWFEFVQQRDGAVQSYDPVSGQAAATFWVPGTPRSTPFHAPTYVRPDGSGAGGDNGVFKTLNRELQTEASPIANRHWLEVGDVPNYHLLPISSAPTATAAQRYQLLSKIANNATTISNAFIIYGTAAYFEGSEDASGHIRLGGRMGLDVDGDGDPRNDSGWERRAIFIVDRTELLNAYDPGTGNIDWQRLIKHRVDLSADAD